MKAVILTDGKPGHENQSIALCRHLGLDYEMFSVTYPNPVAKALSYVFDHFGLRSEKLFNLAGGQLPFANVVISTGSTTFYPNKVLAEKMRIPNVAILHPNGYQLDFDAILCPAYDIPPRLSNITELPLNLCAADPVFFKEKTAEFSKIHKAKRPAVGFIIGGPNSVSDIDPVDLKAKLEEAFRLTEGRERWVTTSRRTPPEIEQLIESFDFDYTLINSRKDYNPIPAFINVCERLFVTSDSASMISECASFGSARVEVLMNRQTRTPNKFQMLFSGLEELNAVHIFDGTLGEADTKIDLKPLLQEALAPFNL